MLNVLRYILTVSPCVCRVQNVELLPGSARPIALYELLLAGEDTSQDGCYLKAECLA